LPGEDARAMSGAAALAALGAAGGAVALGLARRPSTAKQRVVVRSAIFFAWATTVSELVWRGPPPLDGVVTATLVFAAIALLDGRVLGLLALIACEQLVLDGPRGLGAALSTAARLALGLLLARAMERGTHAAWRALAHAAVFVSFVGVLLPLVVMRAEVAAAPRLGVAPSPVAAWLAGGALPVAGARVAGAALLGLAAIAVGAVAAMPFVRAGGTPDPLDPPRVLVTGGIYARVRHPLQLVEVLLVVAAAIAAWDLGVALYAMLFSATLLGPARLVEEELLRRRFPAFEGYARAVPRFVPR
jgi:protein-S-isoprenylcysteine O-methyltransferase Ste14